MTNDNKPGCRSTKTKATQSDSRWIRIITEWLPRNECLRQVLADQKQLGARYSEDRG